MKNTNRASDRRFASFVIEEQLASEAEAREAELRREELDDLHFYGTDLLESMGLIGGRHSDIGMKDSWNDIPCWNDDEFPWGNPEDQDAYDRLCLDMYYDSTSSL